MSAPVEEEEELAEDSMDEDQRGLRGLGKRRSTDTTSSAASKRPRPGSLAEVCFCSCWLTWIPHAEALHTCCSSRLWSGVAEPFICLRLAVHDYIQGFDYI